MYWRVRRHLVKLSMRAMNDLHSAGFMNPGSELLADELDTYVHERMKYAIRSQEPGESPLNAYQRWAYLNGRAVERVSRDSARAALAAWKREWIEERREAGRIGGETSRRGTSYGEGDLAVMWVIRDMSHPAQVRFFSDTDTPWSRATVDRMWAELKQRDDWPMVEPN